MIKCRWHHQYQTNYVTEYVLSRLVQLRLKNLKAKYGVNVTRQQPIRRQYLPITGRCFSENGHFVSTLCWERVTSKAKEVVLSIMSRRIHPAFQTKTVVKLECKYCERRICARGMRALLLADTKVELYSTDLPPEK